MLRNSFFVLVCSLALVGNCVAFPRSQQPSAREPASPAYLHYKELVGLVMKGESTVDFVELIAAASDWEIAEKEVFRAPNRDSMVAAFKNKNYKDAVTLAEGVLNYEFTNRGLHLATANAYTQLHDDVKAELHRNLAQKVLNALLSTGDGKTTETAYCVQGIREEYVIMAYFGYEVASQSYIMSSGGAYDLLNGKDKKTGRHVGLYFDISGYFRHCVESHRQKKS